MVFNDHGAVNIFQVRIFSGFRINPFCHGIRQTVHFQRNAVFVEQSVFKHFKLQLADGADNIAFQGTGVFINLHGPFLSKLSHAF